MSRHRLDLASALLAALSISWLGCSVDKAQVGGGAGGSSSGGAGGSSSGGASGSGGVGQSGGSSGTGGSSATGGKTGSGGTSASGGSPSGGSGGTVSAGGGGAGGSSASGGTTAKGGNGGTGGTKANGGSSGTAGVTGAGGGNAGATAAGGSSAGGASALGGNSGTGGTTATGGGTGSVACTDASTTVKNFTKQYEDGALAVTGSTKTYWAMTNWWSVFKAQTVSLDGLSMKVGNSGGAAACTGCATAGNPTGFPTMFIGTYQNKATVGSNLPKKVSDIKSVPTVFWTNSSSLPDTKNLNAAYDVWFTATEAPLSSTRANSPGTGGAYLMVWLFKPEERRPRGGVPQTTGDNKANFTGQTIPGVPGTWDVWIDKTDPLCISYVASQPIDGLAYDLNNFIQDSVSKQYGITSSMYLSIIFAGTEIWSGGDGFEVKQFCAAVN